MRSLLMLLCLAAACRRKQASDVVIYSNAVIHTMDSLQPRAAAMAVRGDEILAVGRTKRVLELYPGAHVIDLEGACVLPGLIDAHGHLAALGRLKHQLDLRATRSYEELVARVKARAAQSAAGTWILGGRWDQANWGQKAFPTHELLSAATPDRPVLLSRVDGHAALANRKALELAGITRDTKNPAGGEILRDKSGAATGMLVDNAVALVRARIPEGGGESTGALWMVAQEACFRVGLTGVHDAGVASADLKDLRARYRRGELKLRVYAMLSDDENMAAYLAAHKPKSDPRFSVRSLKLHIDGAMGSRGAWMIESYSDRPGHTGLNVMPLTRLRKLAGIAARQGWQVCTHAIGDRANREVLDAYAQAFEAHPSPNHRFRIEHAQCISEPDIPRFAKVGVIASMQPTHATSDMRWAEDRVGTERLKGCYAWKRLLESGARLAFGSDFPVESEDPLWGFFAAVTRQDRTGNPPGGWLPDQILSRETALRLFTLDAAYAAFQEDRVGSLRAGKLADFVVLDRDIMAVPAADILKTRVLQTVIGGETVYFRMR